MIGLTLKIEDRISPYLGGLSADLQRSVFRLAGREVTNALRDHFQMLEQTRPNKKGWPRQHFWSQVRRSVQQPVEDGEGVKVSITHVGIAQRYFGGDIRPVKAEMLTRPAIAEAYGKSAREFNFLTIGFAPDEVGKMRLALVEAPHTVLKFSRTKKGIKIKRGGEIGGSKVAAEWNAAYGEAPRAFYWLINKVHQDPDPSVLPKMEELAARAIRAVANWFNRRRGQV